MFPSRCSGQSPVHSEVAHNGRVVLPEWCGGTPFCGQYQRLQWPSLDIQFLSLALSIPCVIGSGALDGFAVQVRLHIVFWALPRFHGHDCCQWFTTVGTPFTEAKQRPALLYPEVARNGRVVLPEWCGGTLHVANWRTQWPIL